MATEQRDRLVWAMVQAVGDRGYDELDAGDVARHAGLPEDVFQEEFESLEECFYAAYDAVVEELLVKINAAFEREGRWPDKVRAGLAALLRELSVAPGTARMAVVEMPSAGPEAHRRYREAMGCFVAFFEQGRAEVPGGRELPRDVELMAVGGAEAILFDEVIGDRIASLPEMLPELLFALLVPFIGPEAASAEMQRAQGDEPR